MRDTKRKRFKKRIIVIPAIALIVVGALVFGIVRRNKADSVVKVVNVGEVNSVWFLEEGGQYYGTLKKGSVVNYKAEEELEIEDILVKKGDSVSKGDVLFTYNTKSLEFNANTCENELKAIENKITIANNELTILKRLQPSENAPSDYEPEEEPGDETNDVPESYVPTLKLEERITKDTKPYSGSGTSDDPFVYLASDKTVVTKDALISLADGGRYALIYVCMPSGDVMYGRNIDGSRIDKSSVSDWVCSFGISMDAMGGVSVSQETPFAGLVVYPYRVNVLEAGSPEELPEMDGDGFEIPEDYEETTPDNKSDPQSLSTYEISDKDNYMYPRAELNNMIAEKQKEIEKLGLDKKQAEINLKKAQAKLETGAELASISGTVTFIAPDVKHLSDSGYFATITSSGRRGDLHQRYSNRKQRERREL